MKIGRFLVLCLTFDFVLTIVNRMVKIAKPAWGPIFTDAVTAFIMVSAIVFLVWAVEAYSALNGPERVLRDQERLKREAQEQEDQRNQELFNEARRLQRNARQRERYAERRAQQVAQREERRATERMSRRAEPPVPKPATTAEPKSRWDRLLEDDE